MADQSYFEMSSKEAAGSGPLIIEIEGLEELQEALEKFPGEWDRIAREALGPGMALLESDAKRFAPVDTGALRASIGSQIAGGIGSQIVGKVGSAIEYASYQEYGTRYQSGKPYLRPSLAKNAQKVVKMFEQGIDGALKRLGLRP